MVFQIETIETILNNISGICILLFIFTLASTSIVLDKIKMLLTKQRDFKEDK